MIMPVRTINKCLATAMAFGVLAANVLGNAPPQPNLTKTPPVWIGFVFMVILLALVLGVSLMPSKRGHQD